MLTRIQFLLLVLCGEAFALEELVIVKSLSETKRRFVINKGRSDGVREGNRAHFSNDLTRLEAKVIESSQEHSLWEVSDPEALAPFGAEQTVVYQTGGNQDLMRDLAKLSKESSLEAEKEIIKDKIFVQKDYSYFILRAGLSSGIYESISDVSASQTQNRNAFHLEAFYQDQLYQNFHYSLGVRYEYESARTPIILIPTTRISAHGEVIYNFGPFEKGGLSHLYFALGAGFGRSETTIEDAISVGTVLIAPSVKIGYHQVLSDSYALIFELFAETLSGKESYADGEEQTYNIVSLKFSTGLKF